MVPCVHPILGSGGFLAGVAPVAGPVAEGRTAAIGSFRLSVLSPTRRYASDNNGSVATWVEVGATTVLLPGDIEAVAQSELPPLRPDVLMVPHHGSATTDVGWLMATVGARAVLSYGDNTFGHPAAEIVAALDRSSAVVHATANGDVCDCPRRTSARSRWRRATRGARVS